MIHKCKKIEELLPVVSEGQLHVVCPDCNYYYHGQCYNPKRTSDYDPCIFDGKKLPVKEVNDKSPIK